MASPPFPRRLFPRIEPGEGRAVAWSFACFFFLLAGYYVLRPVRETMGITRGIRDIKWLFWSVFLGMLLFVPLYSALVARFPRRVFVPVVYHFFALNLLAFFAAMHFTPEENRLWIGYAYYVWLSVFNLFVVSVFWSFMVDLFREGQGARLFGFISAGGSVGGLCGSFMTTQVVGVVGTVNMLLVAVLLLEASVLCLSRLGRSARRADSPLRKAEGPTGGSIWAGFAATFRSPYLLGIAGYMLLGSLCGTVLYLSGLKIVRDTTVDPDVQTALFAWFDTAALALTLSLQAFATHRLIARLGVGLTLGMLPAFFVIGLTLLAAAPILGVVIAIQAVSRSLRYAVAKPSKELLFTLVSREDRFKAKSFIDTVPRRGGDAVTSEAFLRLHEKLGWSLSAINFAAVPLCAVWIALALFLGRRHQALRGSAQAEGGAGAE